MTAAGSSRVINRIRQRTAAWPRFLQLNRGGTAYKAATQR
jgi:hypothetical protein